MGDIMDNRTPSKVIINFKDIDAANAFTKSLQKFSKIANWGGDTELFIRQNGSSIKCGGIGHDVIFGDIEHIIDDDFEKNKS